MLASGAPRLQDVRRRSWRAPLAVLAKLAVSGLLIAVLLARIDLGAVAASLQGASAAWLLLGIATYMLVPVIGGARWWAALRGLGERRRLGEIVAIFSVAALASQMLPSLAGDGLRAWLAARGAHRLAVVVHSVLLERAAMVLALCVVAAATSPMLAARAGRPDLVGLSLATLAVAACGAGLLLAAERPPVRAAGWRRWPPARAIMRVSRDARALARSGWGAGVASLSLIGHLAFALLAILFGRALGLAATAGDFVAIMPAVTLATTLPISLGGWGVREGALVLLLGHVGVPAGDALALSLLLGAGGVLSGLPGTLAWALGGRRTASGTAALAPIAR